VNERQLLGKLLLAGLAILLFLAVLAACAGQFAGGLT
jgi:hypothetical protein